MTTYQSISTSESEPPSIGSSRAPTEATVSTLSFGSYRLEGPRVSELVKLALTAGIRSIDTAELYKNEAAVFSAVRSFEDAHPESGPIRVSTKIYKSLLFEQTLRHVEQLAQRLGRPVDQVLLHRPLPFAMFRALSAAKERGFVHQIGVSNYTTERLTQLLLACDTTPDLRHRPTVNQVELHPFVGPVQPLLGLCRTEGIRVQAHTVLARGKLFDFAPLQALAARLGATPAAVMLRWAHQLGAELVIHSSQPAHLAEAIDVVSGSFVLSPRDMAEINGYYGAKTVRFYPQHATPTLDSELSEIIDTDEYVSAVAARLRADRTANAMGEPVSNAALSLPAGTNRELLTHPLANRIALELFPTDQSSGAERSYQRFRDLVRQLRSTAMAQLQGQPKAKKLSCSAGAHVAPGPQRFVEGQPVSNAISYPLPMPVEVAPGSELAPFFSFLAEPERLGAAPTGPRTAPLLFTRGAYFPDQRMDLCKQVVGPAHVGKLRDAVVANGHRKASDAFSIRHFLLGNNIACEGSGGEGALAFAGMMQDPALEIETWYLAGNCISGADMGVMARALEHNVHARALWLKRNPLHAEGAAHLGHLLAKNSALCLLDVHNTGLFDEGMQAFADGFLRADGALSLRHLYASANGFGPRSIELLGSVLTHRGATASSLVSLSLSLNRLGNRGLELFETLVRRGALGNLERLDLGSIGLDSPDLSGLVAALIEHCPKLKSFDLGTYLSTRDLEEQANLLRADVSPLVTLLEQHPALELLDVSLCGLPESALERLVDALGPHQSLHGVGSHAFNHSERERRLLKHPQRVLHIDSIYRGRA
ncbi:MAG: aldo/keto reductase [Polyangiaceae bacterium]|nr:aldo/keto reductase [Myxococcales bacterium]MCB9590918.1 aldo/keto reductase [Polyangiaceae bacterium]MCB9609626.1 aldo/keto reductase [Polyangiaceae bacterium]